MSHDIVPTDATHSALTPAGDHPVSDPGIESHLPRFTDLDAAAGNNAYRRILGLLGLVPLLAIVNAVVYFAVPRTASFNVIGTNFNASVLFLGLTGGLAVLLIGIAMVAWARDIMTDEEIAEERHPAASSDEVRAAALDKVNAGIAESGVGRRKLILAALGGGIGALAIPAVVLLADMGPWPLGDERRRTIEKTIWAEGVRLVNDVNKLPLKASDLELGQLVNGEPATLFDIHDGAEFQVQKAKAAIIVVRMDPASIKVPASRKTWQVNGILAYSKICTHVGCPISLWEQQTHHLLCPCHQSTFDLGNSGVVVFGPAARSLPQLPITVDAEGYLVARGDFTVPVGPSYFERDSSKDFKEGDQ